MEFNRYCPEWLNILKVQEETLRVESMSANDCMKLGTIIARLADEKYQKPAGIRIITNGQITFSFLMEGFDAAAGLSMILSGGVFIGAIFMATDYTTSPSTPWGKLIFGLGAGILTCLIRYFGSYPEGVSFAILFMNILNPYICGWTRRKVFSAGGQNEK